VKPQSSGKLLREAMHSYQFGRATPEERSLLVGHVSAYYDPDSDDCRWCRYSRSCADIRQQLDNLRSSVA